MLNGTLAGLAPRTTIEAPHPDNSGECADCGGPADGVDAETLQPLCEECARTRDGAGGGITLPDGGFLDRDLFFGPADCDDCGAMFQAAMDVLAEGVFEHPTFCPFCGNALDMTQTDVEMVTDGGTREKPWRIVPPDEPLGDRPENPNREIEGATWNRYRKTVATWAVRLPVDVTIPTREGEVEGEGGDYLCIDADGGLYPCDGETFERMYEPVGAPEEGDR